MRVIHFHVIFKEDLKFTMKDGAKSTLTKGSCYALNFYNKATTNLQQILSTCPEDINIFKIEDRREVCGGSSICLSSKDFFKYLKQNKIFCFRIVQEDWLENFVYDREDCFYL